MNSEFKRQASARQKIFVIKKGNANGMVDPRIRALISKNHADFDISSVGSTQEFTTPAALSKKVKFCQKTGIVYVNIKGFSETEIELVKKKIDSPFFLFSKNEVCITVERVMPVEKVKHERKETTIYPAV